MKTRIRLCFTVIFLLVFSNLNAWKSGVKIVESKPKIVVLKTEAEVFVDSIKASAKRLKVPYKWLLTICYNESMFNAKAKNKYSTATGIIQFTEGTAKLLGTSTAKLRKMSAVQQIPYAEKYFQKGIDKYGYFLSVTDMYLWCLLPDMRRFATQPYKAVLIKGDSYYAINKGLDEDKNGMVQIYELTNRLSKKAKQIKY